MADPTFSRIEIKLNDRADLERARREILDLAADLRVIINKPGQEDADALILARHRIKTTSQRLRGTNDVSAI